MIWALAFLALLRPDLAIILAGFAVLALGLALSQREPLARIGALIALVLGARLLIPAAFVGLIALELWRG